MNIFMFLNSRKSLEGAGPLYNHPRAGTTQKSTHVGQPPFYVEKNKSVLAGEISPNSSISMLMLTCMYSILLVDILFVFYPLTQKHFHYRPYFVGIVRICGVKVQRFELLCAIRTL